jgi:hypothetical protein
MPAAYESGRERYFTPDRRARSLARVPRLPVVLALVAAALAGCAGDDQARERSPAEPVTGELALGRPAGGAPDAGTSAGHGARTAPTGVTTGTRFRLRGTVAPATSEVRLLDGATLEQAAIATRRGAAFAFGLRHLQPGVNRFVVEATRHGHTPWRQAVRIVSRAPRRPLPWHVRVTGRDRSPARAILRLDRRRLVATAIGRDPGGMSRIRVSADLQLTCRAGGHTVGAGLVHHDPPSQVEHARAAPVARVPAELRRRTDLRALARARCAGRGARLASVEGVVWAEATNAAGLDRYSASVPVGP